jgi:hypothetical protein
MTPLGAAQTLAVRPQLLQTWQQDPVRAATEAVAACKQDLQTVRRSPLHWWAWGALAVGGGALALSFLRRK